MAQRIIRQDWRLDWNFIFPPSLAVREHRGAVWRSKRIGACAAASGHPFAAHFNLKDHSG
jgi:hypothetical protein